MYKTNADRRSKLSSWEILRSIWQKAFHSPFNVSIQRQTQALPYQPNDIQKYQAFCFLSQISLPWASLVAVFDEADNVRSICSSSSFNSHWGDFSFSWENWFPLNFRLRGPEESCGIFIRGNLTKAQLFSEIELLNTLVQKMATRLKYLRAGSNPVSG